MCFLLCQDKRGVLIAKVPVFRLGWKRLLTAGLKGVAYCSAIFQFRVGDCLVYPSQLTNGCV